MNPALQEALAEYVISLGDDELILGHRNSEWCGHAPIIEEDIAFANLALDEIGHAGLWYSLAASLRDQDPAAYPDQLVYFRQASDFRNLILLELPNGDWAFSILRQYLFDALEKARLELLSRSRWAPLAEAAVKISKEEFYHYRHSAAWVRRLGLGTDESNRRMQTALDQLFPTLQQAFQLQSGEEGLVEGGLIPDPSQLKQIWENLVLEHLAESGLSIPEAGADTGSPPRSEHTPHLAVMVVELQSVARSEPEAEW
jgi:ring-1,2-phenylacetyl-CoA epoxidase subunit PaaC